MTRGRWVEAAHRGAVWVAVVAIAGLAVSRLWSALEALLGNGLRAALNLRQRQDEVTAWFAGAPVYETMPSAVYPPGSMSLLWPLLGFGGTWATAGYLALSLLGGLAIAGAFAAVAWREGCSGPVIGLAAVAPMTVLALGDGIGLGQLHLFALVPAVGAGLLARREQPATDVIAGLLFACALVKPSSAAVFGWALLVVGRGRAALVAAAVYVAATVVALGVREESPLRLLEQWWFRATAGARFGAEGVGYGSAHDLVGAMGVPRASVLATLLVVGAAGALAWRARGGDAWVQLGLLGLGARFATYHRSYDDVLVLPAVLAGIALGVRGHRLAGFAAAAAGLALVFPAPPTVRVASWILLGASLVLEAWSGASPAKAAPAG